MHVSSLGFRTDLALLTSSGSVVEDRGTHLVVRSPDNPSYFWGNFLLLAQPPVPGGEREVVAAFRTEFPLAEHVSIGIDTADLTDEARAAVVDLIHEDLTGSARELVLTQELYTLAAREPLYREITHAWMKQSRDALVRHFDPATCRMLDALIEGLSLHAALDIEEHHRTATAEAVAHEQWRTNVFSPPLCWDIETAEIFDEAARHVTPEDVAGSVFTTSDLGRHAAHLHELAPADHGLTGADRDATLAPDGERQDPSR